MYPKGPNRTDANVNSFFSGRYLNGCTSTQRNEISNSIHSSQHSQFSKPQSENNFNLNLQFQFREGGEQQLGVLQ